MSDYAGAAIFGVGLGLIITGVVYLVELWKARHRGEHPNPDSEA